MAKVLRRFGAVLLLTAIVSCSSSNDASPISPPSTLETTTSTTARATTTTSTTLPAPTSIFDGADWEVADPPSSFDVSYIDSIVSNMLDVDGQRALRSVVVVHDDKIVYERYHPTDDDTSIMASFSVAKSFVSTLVGLLVEDGLLALDQPAPVELWSQPNDPRSAITIENLLHMSSGLAWNETYQPQGRPSDVISIIGAYDSLEYAASKPLEARPGSVWKYSSGTTSILSGIISDVLGGPDAVDEYLWSRLLDPIGITSTVLQREPSGKWIGMMGADSTTRDFARFGLLFLHDGYWGDVRVLPDGWVDYARTPAPTANYYGVQWWIEDGEMVARGVWGQTVHVSPSRDLVIAVNRDAGVGSIQNVHTELIAPILEQFEPNAN